MADKLDIRDCYCMVHRRWGSLPWRPAPELARRFLNLQRTESEHLKLRLVPLACESPPTSPPAPAPPTIPTPAAEPTWTPPARAPEPTLVSTTSASLKSQVPQLSFYYTGHPESVG